MNVRVVAAGILALIVSILAVVKLMGTSPVKVSENPNMIAEKSEAQIPLPIRTSGPQPKVSVSEREFQFGRMQIGEERSHEFLFTNEGEAPLTIKMGETTCQCTYGDLKKGETRTIPPGEKQAIKLTWKPEFAAEEFSKGADIWTDDPDKNMQKISLRVVGIVGSRFVVSPQKEWQSADIQDDKPAICNGAVGTGILTEFQITSIETRGKPMEFELEPLAGESLKASQSTFGYRVKLKIPPDMQMGAFAFPITIKTDVPEEGENAVEGKRTEFEVLVTGIRRGPIRFAGPDWIEEKMGIALGAFESSAGKHVLIPLFVRNPPAEGLQLAKPAETTPAELKAEIVREEKSTGSGARLYLKVEYPAGSPRATHGSENPATLRLFTNHPQAPQTDLRVYFNAY